MITISSRVEQKILDKHDVTVQEVHECFLNRSGDFVLNEREHHGTWPPTFWFIAETNHRRVLKIVFIEEDDETITLKTAYC